MVRVYGIWVQSSRVYTRHYSQLVLLAQLYLGCVYVGIRYGKAVFILVIGVFLHVFPTPDVHVKVQIHNSDSTLIGC